MKSIQFFFVLMITLLQSGCGGGGGASNTASAASNTLVSISVEPSTASIPVGGTQQYAAQATYSDGTIQTIVAESWTSSSTATANINSAGLASSTSAGNSVISATFGGKTASANLTVTAATLQSITVTPDAAVIAPGATQQYIATGSYSDGIARLINNPTWSSSLASVATINTSGLATAGMSSGSSIITATYGEQSASVTLTTATPVSLTIARTAGGPTTLPLSGNVVTLSSRINYSNGTSQPVSSSAVLSSSNLAVGTAFSNWGVVPVGVGTTTITVTDAGLSGTIDFTFTAPVPTYCNIYPLYIGTPYPKRTVKQLTAQVAYSFGPSVAATTATWTSSNTNVLTVDANGLLKGVGAGTATVTATADGVVGTQNITIAESVATPSVVVTCNSAAPMTLSAAAWNTGYASDPTNATEWATVDPISCAAHSFVLLVVTNPANNLKHATFEAPNWGGGVFGPASTHTSTITPQLSSGNAVDVGYSTTSSSFVYTPIYPIIAAP